MENLIKYVERSIIDLQNSQYYLKTVSYIRAITLKYVEEHFPLIKYEHGDFKVDVFHISSSEFDIKLIINDSFVEKMKIHYPEHLV